MTDKTFEGAEIDGKQFPFVRVTVANQLKIINRFKPTLYGAFIQRFFPERNNLRMWKRVRSIAFEKTGLWKIGIIPKELRCSEMSLKQAGEIQASFFALVKEIVAAHDAPLVSLNKSLIENKETKSEG
jgi:hypothetical protein